MAVGTGAVAVTGTSWISGAVAAGNEWVRNVTTLAGGGGGNWPRGRGRRRAAYSVDRRGSPRHSNRRVESSRSNRSPRRARRRGTPAAAGAVSLVQGGPTPARGNSEPIGIRCASISSPQPSSIRCRRSRRRRRGATAGAPVPDGRRHLAGRPLGGRVRPRVRSVTALVIGYLVAWVAAFVTRSTSPVAAAAVLPSPLPSPAPMCGQCRGADRISAGLRWQARAIARHRAGADYRGACAARPVELTRRAGAGIPALPPRTSIPAPVRMGECLLHELDV